MIRQPMELSELYRLWDLLSDVPVDGDERLEEPFLHHPAGTHREHIWQWFEAQSPSFKVSEVMQGKRQLEQKESPL